MLWLLVLLLLLFWVGGFAFHVAGSLIHLLLVVAVIVALYNLFVGYRGCALRFRTIRRPPFRRRCLGNSRDLEDEDLELISHRRPPARVGRRAGERGGPSRPPSKSATRTPVRSSIGCGWRNSAGIRLGSA